MTFVTLLKLSMFLLQAVSFREASINQSLSILRVSLSATLHPFVSSSVLLEAECLPVPTSVFASSNSQCSNPPLDLRYGVAYVHTWDDIGYH